MVGLDVERIRQLATDVRKRADTIEGKVPVAQAAREAARGLTDGVVGMTGSQVAVTVEETVKTLDNVLRYHVGRLRAMADMTDKAADSYADMDHTNANDLRKIER